MEKYVWWFGRLGYLYVLKKERCLITLDEDESRRKERKKKE